MRSSTVLPASLLWTLLNFAAASDDCYGGNAVLAPSNATSRSQFLYGLQASFAARLPSDKPDAIPLVLSQPADACQELEGAYPQQFEGKIVLAVRGSCPFTQKAENVQLAGAAVLLVYNSEPGCVVMGANSNETILPNIPVVGISEDSGSLMSKIAVLGDSIVCWAPQKGRMDPAAGVIWVLAVSTVALAGLWAGRDCASGRQFLSDGSSVHGKRPASAQDADAIEIQMVSGASAVTFVVFASSMLIVLYFFLNHIFALVLIALFSLASFQALTVVFAAWIGSAFPRLKQQKVELGWSVGQLSCHSLAAVPPALCWIAAWFASDPVTWGWIFQDGMGVALMLLLLRQFMLPNLKVASLLLVLCFVYDIFWVFVQPMLTSGPSVMVEVATGGSTHESMPMLLQVPSLWGPPYSTSILGYGDVVLPGLLVVFARIWDCTFQKARAASYFLPLLGGYGVGMALTFAALVLRVGGDQGQPALLYLIPCTMGLCMALAWVRGELHGMWRGIDASIAEMKRLQDPETPESTIVSTVDELALQRERLLETQRQP